MQVDVDRLSVAGRQSEQRVEAPHRIAVDSARIDAADDVGTIPQSGIHQRLGPWAVCQAGLRERDNLHVDRIGHCGACPYRRMHMREADVGVDIGMRANACGPVGEESACQRKRPCSGIVARSGAPGPFILDPVKTCGSNLVAVPGCAPNRLVQVGMAIDQTGQEKCATSFLHLSARRHDESRTDRSNPAITHEHIRGCGAKWADMTDQ